ncbi:23392_t:CDS:2, partial [Gigaspora rosea]
IIRIGSKIRKPEWIEQKDWDYLNSSVDYPHYDLSTEIKDLFIELLDTISMKVDGSFQFPDERGLEIGMVELSGNYLTKDLPRYLKDHVKGYWGCRDLLNDIITNFNHSDYKIMRHLRVWFFHVHGLEVQIWGMDLPVSKVYRMFLIAPSRTQKVTLSKYTFTLSIFSIKNYIDDANDLPQKLMRKNSCIINLVEHHMHYDHDDSDYDDPPSPSPSGHSRYSHQLNSENGQLDRNCV